MNVQQASEAANITSYQIQSSFGAHVAQPGRLVPRNDIPEQVRVELEDMGYHVEIRKRTSGPITAIEFDREQGTMWGAASEFGEYYGIGWQCISGVFLAQTVGTMGWKRRKTRNCGKIL